MKYVLAVSLISGLLAGCNTAGAGSTEYSIERSASVAPKASLNEPPSAAVLAAADYGPAPGEDFEAQVRAGMATVLKDPDSAKYRFTPPEKGWFPRYHFDERVSGQPHKHGSVFGWTVRFGVNAKNSFGGYAGEQAYEAFYQGGRLRGILQISKHKDVFGFATWDLVVPIP